MGIAEAKRISPRFSLVRLVLVTVAWVCMLLLEMLNWHSVSISLQVLMLILVIGFGSDAWIRFWTDWIFSRSVIIWLIQRRKLGKR